MIKWLILKLTSSSDLLIIISFSLIAHPLGF